MDGHATEATTRDTRPVVVGVDRSDSARDATEWAADLAAVWGVPLRLVHVVPGTPDDGPTPPTPPWLAELARCAERVGADVGLAGVVSGATVQMVADEASRARLLVLGSYGEGAWTGMLAGSVAHGLIGGVPCPVVVVRGPAPQVPPPRSGPVVAGVDGSAAGHAALMLGADLAESLGARLVAVHTWADIVPGPHEGAPQSREDKSVLAEEGAHLLDTELDIVAAAHPALPVERILAEDTALRALMHHASSARMLAVGYRGRHEVSEMTPGSTSGGLVEFAPCPVVVAKPDSVGDEGRAARTSATVAE
ncbi:universal stress protein [Pseudonocardia sp. CA-142604]|uniref:universal stress protein n=1 Tax=Pseudonocardia sp. CA-142604 TaxID=3240024 RepID=UPI003D8A4C5D